MSDFADEYGGIARYYDAVTRRLLSVSRKVLAQKSLEVFDAESPLPVLDIGCGTATQLIECLNLGLPYIGVDKSAAMLGVAEKKLQGFAGQKQERASLVSASGKKLPFSDNAFSSAIFSLVLHESSENSFLLLDEALRLSPNLFILDWRMPERNLDYPLHLLAHFVERLAGKRHYASFKAFMKQGGLEGLMQRYSIYRKQAGLVDVNISERLHLAGGMLLFMHVTAVRL